MMSKDAAFTPGQVLALTAAVSAISVALTLAAVKVLPMAVNNNVQVVSSLHSIQADVAQLSEMRLLMEQIVAESHNCPHSVVADSSSSTPKTAIEQGFPKTRTINFVYGLWDDKPMRDDFVANLNTWKRLNPAWGVKVWSKQDIKALWKSSFNEYIDVWKLARPIQRADLARLMIVIKFGGLYADLDTAPTKPIDDILQVAGYRSVQHTTVLCIEDIKTEEEMTASARWPIRQGVPEYKTRIANYVFFAQPGSDVLRRTLNLAAKRIRETPSTYYHVQGNPDLNNPYAIIYTSGPDTLTEGTFEKTENGNRRMPGSDVLILPEDKCHMNNLATGTWIGDGAAATKLAA